MERKLRLYVDLMSQPSRAVVIFCRLNKIDAEIHIINVAKGAHKTPEFRAINPMGKVPAIDDGGFKLFESHAILRYLACTRPGVPDHWYPADASRRARVDSILDWHHSNLRRGSATMIQQLVLASLSGLVKDERVVEEAEKILTTSLSRLETVFLKGSNPFLANGLQPSIADLSLACEIKQLELLDPCRRSKLLDGHRKVQAWSSAVGRATAPHFQEVHSVLDKAAKKAQRNRDLAAGSKSPEESMAWRSHL